MDRRIRSLVEVLSGVYHFLQEQKTAFSRPLPEGFEPPAPSAGGRAGAVNEDPAKLAETPPLKLLGDGEVVEALWSGRQSMMRRLLRRLEAVYCAKLVVETPDPEEVVSFLFFGVWLLL